LSDHEKRDHRFPVRFNEAELEDLSLVASHYDMTRGAAIRRLVKAKADRIRCAQSTTNLRQA